MTHYVYCNSFTSKVKGQIARCSVFKEQIVCCFLHCLPPF